MKVDIQSKQDAGWLVFGAVLALVGSLMTGCSGMGLSANVEAYRVDTRSHSSETFHRPLPLKCWFGADCSALSEQTPK